MTDKHLRAQALVDEGRTNKEILATLKEEFGRGVGPDTLRKFRQSQSERFKREKELLEFRKQAFIKKLMRRGFTNHACGVKCKAEFGSGMGGRKLKALRAEVEAEQENHAQDLIDAVEPVDIPPEVFEDLLEGCLVDPDEPPVADPPALACANEVERSSGVVETPPVETVVPETMEAEPDPPTPSLAPSPPALQWFALRDLRSLQDWMRQEPNVSAISLTRDGKLSVSMCYHFNLEDLNGNQ
jgi:hypothetical protein